MVLGYVASWRRLKGEEVTPEDRNRFGRIDPDVFYNRMCSRLQGETPIIERINPEDNTVIYVDSGGRNVIALGVLGYKWN